MSTMSRLKRNSVPLAAAAVAAAVLPLGAGPVEAASPTSATQVARQSAPQAEPGFAGYASTAKGAPVRIEIYEPTIPLPATPQAELSLGYSAIVADSTSGRARASYLWPGDPVGEGFKTIVEQLGLPPELAEPLAAQGYPVQVNAVFPGGPESESDEPFPGTIQRAEASENKVVASNGFSTDGNVKDEDEDGGNGGGGGGGDDSPIPGLPELPLPDLPGLPLSELGSGGLSGLLGSVAGTGTNDTSSKGSPKSSGKRSSRTAAAAPESDSPLPPELAILLDLGGFSSISKSTAGDVASSQSRANVGNISLLGGLVTIEGVKTLAKTSSDGKKGTATGESSFGDLVAFGQRFRFGPDGYEAVGQKGSIPGLPDDAAKALEMLGLKISTPKPVLTTTDDAAEAVVQGLVIDFDLTALKTQLSPVVDLLNTLTGQIPDQAGPLKGLLQAAANLSPRIVFTLGNAASTVDTSQAIDIPDVEVPETPIDEPATDTAPSGGTGGTSSSSSGGDSAPPVSDAPSGDTGVPTTDTGTVPVAAAQQPGLPALFSIPMLLILIGIGLASLFGTYMRRLGLAALGGAASCPHGLTSGVPDLRKTT
ncbi:choice-of-anchor P family protein [Nocardioides sp.]|uniref:choice-of-anchor P family protein n=1 Tax=Nocardioides sp. TaxID=35761 RepID=UPI000C958A44|nr:choice-of-anchor P family protein [Nocardioides sp.]MAS56922.1 hypothetical protein [Pimelobacter sp.]MDE0778209.1 hypothetical protein [Nocardioides sp.]